MAPPDRHRTAPPVNQPVEDQRPIIHPDSSDGGTHILVDVTVDEVTTGAEDLFSTFLHHHLERDGHTVPQSLNHRRMER